MFVTSAEYNGKNKYTLNGWISLIVLCIVSILSTVIVVVLSARGQHVFSRNTSDHTHNMKLRFMYLFGVGIWTHYIIGNSVLHAASSNPSNISCFASNLYRKSRLMMEPMVLEYSLLANLLILGMWPKEQTHEQSMNDSHPEYETMEMSPLLLQYRSKRSGIKFSVFCALIGILIMCPVIVFRILHIHRENGKSIEVLASYSFSNTALICLTIKCLHLLSIECRHVNNNTSHSSEHTVLLFGSSGYMFFVTLSLFNDIHRNDNAELLTRVLAIYMELTFIVSCFLQCILILEADKCVKIYKTDKLFFISVENICLMLGFIHLGSWFDSTFLSESYSMPGGNEAVFYSKRMYSMLFTIFFPFRVFFHFKCFIFFYGMYRRFKRLQ
ncbi:uncharacterized protein LOC134726322 [Mytilus trossulus]|uniref:uncharacterized protein LOC134726322 n=1 Tax=Mytilus trossulus TaxID=6551 RepID=UPI003007C425